MAEGAEVETEATGVAKGIYDGVVVSSFNPVILPPTDKVLGNETRSAADVR